MERRLAKLVRRARNNTAKALNNTHIPGWIRDIKRKQLERNGFLPTK